MASIPHFEPRNAAEAQLQNKFSEDISPDVYQKWVDLVNASAPEKQVWLRTLEDQLGGYYFPHYLNDDLFGEKPYDEEADGWAYIEDDASLPRLLIVGDSISRASTAHVRKALKGKANVHRAPANCGPTSLFLEHCETWLKQNGSNQWDFVTVNFGIHDGKNPDGYEGRLRQVIDRLKETGAKKIFWVRTTPWGLDDTVFEKPEGDASVITNPISDLIAAEYGLTVIDAHAILAPYIDTMLSRNDFAHWQPKGYEILGQAIGAQIEPSLVPAT